ncbi:hypothetical protein [Flavobacterium alkalisoli]|uniref:hypothetical protein n=1 Tax=Flavobacterium alkalisoli TaxID=2602769 RepID=UPI003A90751A
MGTKREMIGFCIGKNHKQIEKIEVYETALDAVKLLSQCLDKSIRDYCQGNNLPTNSYQVMRAEYFKNNNNARYYMAQVRNSMYVNYVELLLDCTTLEEFSTRLVTDDRFIVHEVRGDML